MISGAKSMLPSATRNAPSAKVAAAPTAIPVSVIPRASEFVARTHMVELKRWSAFSLSVLARGPLCPKDFRVASPCTESKNSAANALYERERERLFFLSQP